jgi:hypothetical protein
VVASDAFDDFIADIAPYVATLPVVTAELGDTWMMGADADPCVRCVRVLLCFVVVVVVVVVVLLRGRCCVVCWDY